MFLIVSLDFNKGFGFAARLDQSDCDFGASVIACREGRAFAERGESGSGGGVGMKVLLWRYEFVAAASMFSTLNC